MSDINNVISNNSNQEVIASVERREPTSDIGENLLATGLEAKGQKLSDLIENIDSRIDKVYRGVRNNRGITFPGKRNKINGIMPILLALNEIDFCNLVAYITNSITFNEENPSGLSKTVSKLQDKSKKLIKIIDTVLLLSDELVNNNIAEGDIVTILTVIPRIEANVGDRIRVSINNISILRANPQSFIKSNNKLQQTLLAVRDSAQEIISIVDDPDLLAVIPQLAQGNNFLNDFLTKLERTVTLESIPNEEARKIFKKLRDLRTILTLIVGINSLRDALGAVQTISGLNIDKQIQKFQKSLSISKLIPIIKNIINLVNNINQAGQNLLKYIKLIQTYVRLTNSILRVFRAVIRLLRKLPIPTKFTLLGKVMKLSDTLQKFEGKINEAIRVVDALNTIIQIILTFIQGLLVKLQNINKQLQILENNLQLCDYTGNLSESDNSEYTDLITSNLSDLGINNFNRLAGFGNSSLSELEAYYNDLINNRGSNRNSPLVEVVRTARLRTVNTINELNNFMNKFNQSRALNLNTVGGFILQIQEEELVDEGIKYRRRRGIALDSNGILVEQTDLTFATDINIILEELKLKLQNRGYIQSTPTTGTGYPDLDILLQDITIPGDFAEEDDTELDEEYISIQKELNTVIDNIKGAPQLKKRVQENVSQDTEVLNEEIQSGEIPVLGDPSPTDAIAEVKYEINTATETTTQSADIISDEERADLEKKLEKYKKLLRNITRNPIKSSTVSGKALIKKYKQKIKEIEEKLEKDKKAREIEL